MIYPPATLLLRERRQLIARIEKKLAAQTLSANRIRDEKGLRFKSSAILFPLCACPPGGRGPTEICLVLTKRSPFVRQPGDLCCPGGSYSLPLDRLLAGLLGLPHSPLRRWSCWRQWQIAHGPQAGKLKLLLAAGLREAWEEMRLSPLQTRFLGPMPEQRLVLFDRVIYPMAVWVDSCRSIRPNWEVQRVVFVPLRRLLDPNRYGRFRPWLRASGSAPGRVLHDGYFTCFVHRDAAGQELLWGATLRVVQDFLTMVFGFTPRPVDSLPIVDGRLDGAYPHGSGRNGRRGVRYD